MRAVIRSTFPVLVASALLLAGCQKRGEGKQAEETDTKKTDAQVPDEVKPEVAIEGLTLGAAKFIDAVDPEQGMEIAADGTVSVRGEDGSPAAKVTSDGKVTLPDGELVVELGPEGVLGPDGKTIATMADDGTLSIDTDGNITIIKFAEDGTIVAEPAIERLPEIRTEGCTGEVARTCALVLIGWMVADHRMPRPESGEPSEVDEPGEPGEPDEPDEPGEVDEPGEPGEVDEPNEPGEPSKVPADK